MNTLHIALGYGIIGSGGSDYIEFHAQFAGERTNSRGAAESATRAAAAEALLFLAHHFVTLSESSHYGAAVGPGRWLQRWGCGVFAIGTLCPLLEGDKNRTDFGNISLFKVELVNGSIAGRGHFDNRLGRLYGHEWLIRFHGIALLDQPVNNFGLLQAFTKIGEF